MTNIKVGIKEMIAKIKTHLLAGSLLALATSAQAHHSFAVHFVSDKLVEVKGVVTGFRFSNPHGILSFDVTKADGSIEHWRAETNSPNSLRRRGWTKDSFKLGDTITVVGFPARDDTAYMRISKATFDDGHVIVGQGMAAPAADGDKD
jgi:hypothetical protein